jgi:hypothetical protein
MMFSEIPGLRMACPRNHLVELAFRYAGSMLKGQGLDVDEASLACFEYKMLRLTL